MMKHVLLLVLKDFQVQFRSMLNYIAVGLMFMFIFTLMGNSMLMAFQTAIFIIIYGFINKAFYEDEKNNTLRLLVSLPLRRDVIVLARYLGVGIMVALLGTALGILAAGVGITLPMSGAGAGAEAPAAFLILCICLVFMILMSVYLPLAFKLGYIKAVNINRFLLFGIFALFGVLPSLLGLKEGKTDGLPRWLEDAGIFLQSVNPAWLTASLILFTILIYAASLCVSIRFFRKRQLF